MENKISTPSASTALIKYLQKTLYSIKDDTKSFSNSDSKLEAKLKTKKATTKCTNSLDDSLGMNKLRNPPNESTLSAINQVLTIHIRIN